MKFENSYSLLPDKFFAQASPALFPHAKLISINHELANELGFDETKYSEEELAQIFSGQKILEGSHFLALAYAGHQFGQFVPSLGDGRAILLGEVKGKNHKRYDLQLKGSGPTHFSRRGDGKSALGPVVREYIVSEAMFHLGVPTTRALAAVATGEFVARESEMPGGVFTRVASSHLRIGTFEYFAARGDLDALKALVQYSLKRHYPDVEGPNSALILMQSVIKAQVHLVSKWMSLGFIHGVMNTDNMSISGETIDFGPCAFMDYFNPNQVYSYIDRQGRYSYLNQSNILVWNLSRLADCLIPLVDSDEKQAIQILNTELSKIKELFKEDFHQNILKKLGISAATNTENETMVQLWFEYLAKEKLDFTLSFRHLSQMSKGETNTPDHFFKNTKEFHHFLSLWTKVSPDIDMMNGVNPIYIPRNHQVEKAIQASLQGDYSLFFKMNQLLKSPYTEQVGFSGYELAPNQSEVIKNTFCGT
ncbi:MAG: protein adenylyltransferase SelO [Bacteriovoracaceae bacterium]